MKADRQLEWKEFLAGRDKHHEASGYVIYRYTHEYWRLEGNGLDRVRYDLEELKAFAQEDHNRRCRRQAWEEYMLTHEPPEVYDEDRVGT